MQIVFRNVCHCTYRNHRVKNGSYIVVFHVLYQYLKKNGKKVDTLILSPYGIWLHTLEAKKTSDVIKWKVSSSRKLLFEGSRYLHIWNYICLHLGSPALYIWFSVVNITKTETSLWNSMKNVGNDK